MAYLIMASYQIWRKPNKTSIKLSGYQLLGKAGSAAQNVWCMEMEWRSEK